MWYGKTPFIKNCWKESFLSSQPPHLPACDPHSRYFPVTWKESFFRRNFNHDRGGYVCPSCNQIFSGVAGFHQIEADHIIPYSQGGLTVWENLILLCRPCNMAKRDKMWSYACFNEGIALCFTQTTLWIADYGFGVKDGYVKFLSLKKKDRWTLAPAEYYVHKQTRKDIVT